MQQKIPEELIDQIVSQNDIVDVISEHVKLTKKGRNYFGLCPFHGENTPSFSVSPDKQIFHCFGCGKGGNVIKFIMELNSTNFVEAIQALAEQSGETIPEQFIPRQIEETLSESEKDALQAYEWSTKLFHHVLKHTTDGREGLNYLQKRGFQPDDIEQFQLGYSPPKNQFLSTFLQKKGFSLENLLDVGLLSSRDGNTFFDRFKGRVIFPIQNHQGKVVGFGGRAVEDGVEPKYLNSPESKLFQKGKILYNFYQARKHFQKQKKAVLFEGYADVIKAHRSGVYHSVATLGTSLSPYQANLLKRYVDTVIICFDGDQAGRDASDRAAKTLKEAGLEVRVASIPNQMDPDDFIENYGSEKFHKQVLTPAESYIAFSLNFMKKDFNLQTEHDQLAYIEKALDLIATVDHAVERDVYLKDLSETFDLYRDTLEQEIQERRRINKRDHDKDNHVKNNEKQPKQWKKSEKIYLAYQNAERYLIAHMLQDDHIANQVQQRLGSKFNMEEHQVLVTYLYAYYEEGNQPDVSRFMQRLPDDSLRQLTAELALIPINESLERDELNDYLFAITKESDVEQEIRSLEQMLKKAEKENDPKSAARIGMKILELRKKSNKSKL
ncbi:DNA primase [Alkalibacillus aidingensis]|uniref:DNA primase n=1 Tax=Alkalibacillus aidingensis TaxID=2747607 RepID=UPI001660F556|nr:DNA primase [Alkalibacillus aidingensis]